VSDALESLYGWLCACAAAGEACPTNAEIADRFGRKSVSSAARLVSILEKQGRITVTRTNVARTVTITATGARTAEMESAGRHGRRRKRRNSLASRLALARTLARKKENAASENGVGEIARYPAPPLGRSKLCQWIENDPTPDDSCKCLAPVVDGWPYCYEHLERAYNWGSGQGADAKPEAAE